MTRAWLDGLDWADDLISTDVDGWGVTLLHFVFLAERGVTHHDNGMPASDEAKAGVSRMIGALESAQDWRRVRRATLIGALVTTAVPFVEDANGAPALDLHGSVSLVGIPLMPRNLLALVAMMRGHDALEVAALSETNRPALGLRSGPDRLALLMGCSVSGPALDGEVWP